MADNKKEIKVDHNYKRFQSISTVVILLAVIVIVAILVLTRFINGKAGIGKVDVDRLSTAVTDDINRVEEVTSWVDVENKKLNLPEELVDNTDLIGINERNTALLTQAAAGADKQTSNFMVSPVGLDAMLQMAQYGAAGDTLEQLKSFVGSAELDLNSEAVNSANIVAVNTQDSRARIKDAYESLLENSENIEASIEEVTSANKTTLADKLNNQISELTNGQIASPIASDTFTQENFIALLVNVLHFKGTWADVTETGYQTEDNFKFKTVDGEKLIVPAVCMIGNSRTNSIRYYTTPTVKAFSVDYAEDEGRYRFYGFLPNKGGEIRLSDLDLTNLKEPNDGAEKYFVDVRIPKFKFDSSTTLNDTLKGLGLTDMFDSTKADFSEGFEVADGYNVYFSLVKQDTAIDFNEKGTEASAVTQGTMEVKSAVEQVPETYELNFDRPFLFMIYDTQLSKPLFVGQVYNPAE